VSCAEQLQTLKSKSGTVHGVFGVVAMLANELVSLPAPSSAMAPTANGKESGRLRLHVAPVSRDDMTSNEVFTHALEFVALRYCLDDGSPQGHEHGGIAACGQIQESAERVQGPVDVAWTPTSRPRAECAAWWWRARLVPIPRPPRRFRRRRRSGRGPRHQVVRCHGRSIRLRRAESLLRAAAGYPFPYLDLATLVHHPGSVVSFGVTPPPRAP
jgi:hypothetical protein